MVGRAIDKAGAIAEDNEQLLRFDVSSEIGGLMFGAMLPFELWKPFQHRYAVEFSPASQLAEFFWRLVSARQEHVRMATYAGNIARWGASRCHPDLHGRQFDVAEGVSVGNQWLLPGADKICCCTSWPVFDDDAEAD